MQGNCRIRNWIVCAIIHVCISGFAFTQLANGSLMTITQGDETKIGEMASTSAPAKKPPADSVERANEGSLHTFARGTSTTPAPVFPSPFFVYAVDLSPITGLDNFDFLFLPDSPQRELLRPPQLINNFCND